VFHSQTFPKVRTMMEELQVPWPYLGEFLLAVLVVGPRPCVVARSSTSCYSYCTVDSTAVYGTAVRPR
jgi:hypothetical protein